MFGPMMKNPETPITVQDILALVPGVDSALICFDCDLTLSNGVGKRHIKDFELRPEAFQLISELVQLGHEVHIWTAGGKSHADFVTEMLNVQDIVSGTHAKVGFPPTQEAVIELLGRLPDVIIDDNLEETIPSVPIFHADAFWGSFAEGGDNFFME